MTAPAALRQAPLAAPPRIATAPTAFASRWPCFEADEIEAVAAVLASGRVNALVHGDETRAFERAFADFVGVEHAIAVANGTLALELALHALGIGRGDEVIVPARSFFATASCVAAVGATPVFADIDPGSQTIAPDSAARMIGPRTRAIVCVHLSGWPCDMARLRELCDAAGVFLVEDCAQAHGAAIHGRRVGSFGDIAAFSFCTDKIMSTGGEGGMVTTADRALWARAWAYKDHGKDPDRLRTATPGNAFRYMHDSFGSNFRLTEMQAAIGRRQLAKLPVWLRRRQANAEALRAALRDHPAIECPPIPDGTTPAWYRCNVQVRPAALPHGLGVEDVVGRLRAQGIACASGGCPDMSRETAFRGRHVRTDGGLPVAQQVAARNIMFAVDHSFEPQTMVAVAGALRGVLD
ncbi:DegT/DnrJ/EryC1/StrS family aminotransferase [Sphingomonas koreensis]|nr:DegT/DnrJ/EryC1/StrS family aminotransferase [Sphingomonas koreensis]